MAELDLLNLDYEDKYGFRDPEVYVKKLQKGLSAEVIREISETKGEPEWMLKFRLKALDIFYRKKMPAWGADLSAINFDDIIYYIKPSERKATNWEDVPEKIKQTFEKLGIPEAERKFLGGSGAQYESEVVYHKLREDLEKKGVVFLDTDTGLKDYESLFKQHFGTVVPPHDNKFAALNSAAWSGGSFIYIPKNVKVEMPLQAYFRINAQSMGQFERTLIIADEGASVTYVEGCLPEGELVSTGEGMVEISSVREGQTVINSDGFDAKVKKTMVRPYKGRMIEIVPVSSGNKFKVTPEHPVLAIKREVVLAGNRKNRKLGDIKKEKLLTAEAGFVPAGDLKDGDLIIFPVNKVAKNNENISDDLLSFLGFYLAEGHVGKNNGYDCVMISLNIREVELRNTVKKLIEKLTGKRAFETIVEEKSESRIGVNSESLSRLCERHCGKYSDLKKLSKEIMELPPNRQELLIDSYYKGDGSISLGKPIRIRATTVSRQLAYQMQELLSRQGIYACINIREPYDEIMQDGKVIFHKRKYTLFYAQDRKSINVKLIKDKFIVPIRKINTFDFSGNVYNFELSEAPNAYLAMGFAVHNCTAPVYSTNSLHAAVVELIAMKNSKIRYTTIQNWSSNVYNLVTKRAFAYEHAFVEWIDGNLGSSATMKYPSVYLLGRNAKADILSVAFAGKGQHQDAGGKALHFAPDTTSTIISKSISKGGGRTSYRGLLHVEKGATGVKSNVRCDALILDEASRSDTYPYMKIEEQDTTITHEATVGKIGEDKIFYLMSRGLTEQQAIAMIVLGFVEQFTKELPMEYAVELNRLIRLEMAGSVG